MSQGGIRQMGRAKFHKLYFIRIGLLLAGLLAITVIISSQSAHAQGKPSPSDAQSAPTAAPLAAQQQKLMQVTQLQIVMNFGFQIQKYFSTRIN